MMICPYKTVVKRTIDRETGRMFGVIDVTLKLAQLEQYDDKTGTTFIDVNGIRFIVPKSKENINEINDQRI